MKDLERPIRAYNPLGAGLLFEVMCARVSDTLSLSFSQHESGFLFLKVVGPQVFKAVVLKLEDLGYDEYVKYSKSKYVSG